MVFSYFHATRGKWIDWQTLFPLALLLCAACAQQPNTGEQFLQSAVKKAFTLRLLETPIFDLQVADRIRQPGKPLVVYIEGDGHAWQSRFRLSTDPTPHNPLALRLALSDPRPNIAYIARPCQFVLSRGSPRNCSPSIWSSHRYSESVIASVNAAIEQLRQRSMASEMELVGFSGGGAVATLVAAQRDDISLLRTLAGNLDHKNLMKHHRVSPLQGSLNPIDNTQALGSLCQVHYSGESDTTVPPFIAARFINALPQPQYARHIVLSDTGHERGWLSQWRELLNSPLPCEDKNP